MLSSFPGMETLHCSVVDIVCCHFSVSCHSHVSCGPEGSREGGEYMVMVNWILLPQQSPSVLNYACGVHVV